MESKLKSSLSDVDAKLAEKPEDSDLLMQRAYLYRKLCSYGDVKAKIDLEKKAIADFETVNRLAGPTGSVKALVGIARTYLTTYQITKVAEYLVRVQAIDSKDVDVRIETAVLEGMLSDDWAKASSTLELILKEPGMQQNARLWHLIGLARYRSEKYPEAREAYLKSIELEPEVIERWTNVALTYADEGNIDEAKKYYDRVRSVDSTNQFAIINLTQSLTQTNDPKKNEEAVQMLQQMLSTGPGIPAAYNNLGNALNNLGRFEEAEDAYLTAASMIPCFVGAIDNLGLLYAKWNRFDDAIEAFKKGIACQPDSTRLYYGMGNAFLGLKKYEDAIAAFKKAAEFDPKDVRAWTNLGASCMGAGRLDDAEKYTEHAISVNPKHALAVANRGAIEMRRKQHAKAIPYFIKAVGLDPARRGSYNDLNISALYSGQFEEVDAFYKKQLSETPSSAIVIFYKAGLDFQRGQFSQAASGFAETLKVDPKFAGARLQKGLAHLGQGKPQEALADLKAEYTSRPERCYGYFYSSIANLRAGESKQAIDIAQIGLRDCKDDEWGVVMLRYAAGELNDAELIAKADLKEKQVEANFAIAEKTRAEKDKTQAADWYRKCVDTGVKEYFEYALCNDALSGS